MKLSEVTAPTLKQVADYAFDEFARMKEARRSLNKDQPKEDGPGVMMFAFRDFGSWEMPEGEEDDGDYDWEVMTSATAKVIQAVITQLASKYPGFKFDWQTGEKNWFYVTVAQRK